jgi:hypothetical protein
MLVVAVSAVMMGLYRWSPPIVYRLLDCVALYILVLVCPVVLIPCIAVYDWFVRARRRYSRHQSPIRETRAETKRGVEERVG